MLIGVDCGHLLEGGRTGTQNYLYNLLRNLALVDVENEYLLYFRTAPSDGFWYAISQNNKKWKYSVLHNKRFWTQVGLAHATFMDRPDRLLCTWHTLPLVHRQNTRIITVIHDFSYRGYRNLFLYACLYLSYRVVVVSDATYAGAVRRTLYGRNRITRIYEGVDTERYRKSASADVSATRNRLGLTNPFFLSVGTLTRRKNLETMLEAFVLFTKRHRELHLDYVIVGNCSPGYEHIYTFVSDVAVQDRIKFVGSLNDIDVVNLYSGATALLYVSWEEGFGLPILEAFACSCPVITSNISSTKEVAGSSAWLVPPDAPLRIEEAMDQSVNDAHLVDAKVRCGLTRVKDFSWKSCAQKIVELY